MGLVGHAACARLLRGQQGGERPCRRRTTTDHSFPPLCWRKDSSGSVVAVKNLGVGAARSRAGTFPSPCPAARRRRRGPRRAPSSAPRSAVGRRGGAARSSRRPAGIARASCRGPGRSGRSAGPWARAAGADDGDEGQAAGSDDQHIRQSITEAAHPLSNSGCLRYVTAGRPDDRIPGSISPGSGGRAAWCRHIPAGNGRGAAVPARPGRRTPRSRRDNRSATA